MFRLGNNIQNLRKSKKISQERLAEMIEVSRQSISKWERNDDYPSWEKLPDLCKAFGCNIEDLISDEELGKITDLEKLKEISFKIDGTDTTYIISVLQHIGVDKRVIDVIPKNSFEHFIDRLENYYVSKHDGMDRIKEELSKWNSKARKAIVISLIKRFVKDGVPISLSRLIEFIEVT